VGGAGDFPNAEILCAADELVAHRRRGLGYRAADLAHSGAVRALRLDQEARYGFPASFDLFDDGELVLLDARGHTAGSVAVALRPQGPRAFLHVGDAVFDTAELLVDAKPTPFSRFIAWNRAALQRTHRAIASAPYAEDEVLEIVPSHDAAVFAGLPHEPRHAAAVVSPSPSSTP
jgi:glyoxylase-like metal-dependent hydrolase (beta-lactamase superfamily II)